MIFDFDGVLVNSEPLHFRAMRDSLIPEGIVIDGTEYLRNYVAFDDRTAIRVALEQHGHPSDVVRVEIVADRKARMFAEMKNGIPFFPGARELVRELQREVPLGIASGALHSEIEDLLQTGGIRDAFAAIVGADDVARTKPDPEPYLEALRQIQAQAPGIEAADCVALEDTPRGIAAALAAGMIVVGIAQTYEAAVLTAAHHVLPSLRRIDAAALRALAVRPAWTSRHLDPDQAKRHAEHKFDFNRKGLGGRVVLLPGGAGGIGAAVTSLLLQEGALPVVAYRANRGRALAFQQKVQDQYGGPIHLVEADVTDPAGRQRMIDAALGIKGELYGLVALTGDPARVKPADLDGPALHASFTANYEAPVLLARACAAHMAAKSVRGAIVLISSMQGVHAFEGSLAYAGPKAALVHAARILAKEFGGEQDIRVNVVAPGVTTAGMARASVDAGKYDPYIERAVIPRFGRPEDVAKAVRFLLEPDSYVTGQVLTVDARLTLRRDLVR